MKTPRLVLQILVVFSSITCYAQIPEPLKESFPKSTVTYQNIPYAKDTLKNHLLDIYLPPDAKANTPLVVWIHGGGWIEGDKYTAMQEMKRTVKSILENGYALASINYRYSSQAIFPAQMQDCMQALQFLYDNATQYKLDNKRIAVLGLSSGGHLGNILGLAINNSVTKFYPPSGKPSFTIKAVVDFYGPTDLLLYFGFALPEHTDNPAAMLLGASPLVRPDLCALASPFTYVDKNDPPFFIVHGEKDQDVPLAQTYLLKSWLDLAQVKNDLTIVKDAPHHSVRFDEDDVRLKLLAFLNNQLK